MFHIKGPHFILPTSLDPRTDGVYNELCAAEKDFQDTGEMHGVRLFDVVKDPSERNNVASSHPDIVDQMLRKISEYSRNTIPYKWMQLDCLSDPDRHGGAFRPWSEDR